jgi:hypothetical protein
MSISRLLGLFLMLWLAGSFLSGCQLQNFPQVEPSTPDLVSSETIAVDPTNFSLADETPGSTITVDIFSTSPAVEVAIVDSTLHPTPSQDPLRLVLPEQGAVPVAAWRPPLYPTPWAPTEHDHFYFSRPIAADQINWPAADYRYGGIFLPEVVHTGVDIPAPLDTPVLAAGPGKIVWVGYGLFSQKEDLNDPYGLAIAIRHDFGYGGETLYTVYGHLSRAFVARGQHVEGGEAIGLVGDTGKTTGVHLHFEVRIGNNAFSDSRNPELWLAPPQGWGVLAARIMSANGLLMEHHPILVRDLDTGQSWTVKSYGGSASNSDPYYRENLVMGDLPAGNYEVWVDYLGRTFNLNVQIQPGLVTFFSFRGQRGFNTFIPTPPGADFTPEFVTPEPGSTK